MKQFKKQIVATRNPPQIKTDETAQPQSEAQASQQRVRFRRLIDKDEVDAIVAAAIDANAVPDVYVKAFCEQEGYVGLAAHRVAAQVVHLYSIRKTQHDEAKRVMTK